jgi:hypothetical protein
VGFGDVVSIISNLRKHRRGALLLRLITFFFSSLCGVITDIALFQIMTVVGLSGFFSNVISSWVAVTLTYFLATRFSMKVAPRFASYLVFIVWYAFSILLFSRVIDLLIVNTTMLPIMCKIVTLPCSFTINFAFNNFVIRRMGPNAK